MFLQATIEQNPLLIKTALQLHQEGQIAPNTYLLDLDSIRGNARLLADTARRHDIQLYMMTKQIGRNPEVAKRIAEEGIEKAVAVDPWEAVTLAEAGVALGNVGHLVQIPRGLMAKILSFRPEVVTVFSVEKALEVGAEATRQGYVQDILLKVVGKNDMIYEGQLGGFKEELLLDSARRILQIPGVRIVGCTVFPCLLFNSETKMVEKTPNADTLLRSVNILQKELDIQILQINGPSATSANSIPLLKQLGVTHGEPGHALTGTTPLHAYEKQPEIPSMVYVSEVSHIYDGRAYVYGGGHYRRSRAEGALVGSSFDSMVENVLEIDPISPENIDYYGALVMKNRPAAIGDTAIFSYRTQIFVTRSHVALVEGIQNGKPRLVGVYDNLGKKLR